MIICESFVKEIDFKSGIIFVACGSSILTCTDTKNIEILARFNPNIEDVEIKAIKYSKDQERVYAGYSVIITLEWNVSNMACNYISAYISRKNI